MVKVAELPGGIERMAPDRVAPFLKTPSLNGTVTRVLPAVSL